MKQRRNPEPRKTAMKRFDENTELCRVRNPFTGETRVRTPAHLRRFIRDLVKPELWPTLLSWLQAELLQAKSFLPPAADPTDAERARALAKLLAAPAPYRGLRTRKTRSAAPSARWTRRWYRKAARNLTDAYCARLIRCRWYAKTGEWLPRELVTPAQVENERRRQLAKRG